MRAFNHHGEQLTPNEIAAELDDHPRSFQSLMAARRALVQEQRFETDETARLLLQFSIDEIDREVQRRMFEPRA